MNFLLIDDDSIIIDLLAVILEGSFSPKKVDKCLSPQDGIECLKTNQYDVVICDFDMPPHGTGEEVYNHIKINNINTKFVLFTSKKSDDLEMTKHEEFKEPNFYFFQKGVSSSEIKSFLKSIIQDTHVIQETAFCPVRIHNFLRFDTTKCSVYVRLSDNKYVKVLNAFSKYDNDFIDHYIKKGVEFFYIEKENFDKFSAQLGSTNFLEDTTDDNFIAKAQKTHRYLGTLLHNVGMSKFVIGVANDVSEKVLNQAMKEKGLSSLLDRLLNSKDYSYDHTYLISALCIQLGKEVGLSHNALERLSFVSLIHDVGIVDPEACYIHDIKPDLIKDLEEKQVETIKKHHDILEKFKSLPDITDDINTIMKHQHIFDETYPFNSTEAGLDSFNTVVSVFLVAHHFSNEMYKNDFNKDKLRDSLTYAKFIFKSANFKKILRALEIIIL